MCAITRANEHFSYSITEKGEDRLVLTVTEELKEGWHATGDLELEGSKNVKKVGPVKKLNEGTFQQTFKITGKRYVLRGYMRIVECDDEQCLAPEYVEFDKTGFNPHFKSDDEKSQENDATNTDSTILASKSETDTIRLASANSLLDSPLWAPQTHATTLHDADDIDPGFSQDSNNSGMLLRIILLGFIGGLLALFTPCVWPIIPLTVSFFLKRNKRSATHDVMLFGGCIIALFVTLGLLMTIAFGANAMNTLSTSAFFNLVCFVILVFFGLSLLGLYNIKLPNKWENSLDDKATKATGLISIFFMALTLVVVSFSCTAPVIGLLLVEVATEGSLTAPLLGMTSFAIALALPFMLFAFFPKMLSHLPRSGAWMKHIKVILGVLEIAFSLKFLGVADDAYGWDLMTSHTFLFIWAMLFAGLAIYLAYRTKGIRRVLTPILPLMLSVYLLLGIQTGNTSLVAAFMPVDNDELSDVAEGMLFKDYEKGMAFAKANNKRVFLNFTGYGCVNCRKMEKAVFTDETVKNKLKEFVIIDLYVDDRTPLKETVSVTLNGKEIKLRCIGDKWSLLEQYKFGSQSQPLYVILNGDGKALSHTYGYDEDVEKFLDFLK